MAQCNSIEGAVRDHSRRGSRVSLTLPALKVQVEDEGIVLTFFHEMGTLVGPLGSPQWNTRNIALTMYETRSKYEEGSGRSVQAVGRGGHQSKVF